MVNNTVADKAPALIASLAALPDLVEDAVRNGSTFHDFELSLWRTLLRLGHDAIADFLGRQGPGDLGEELALPNGQTVRRLPELHSRPFTCLFGHFTLVRACYGSREGQKIDLVPLDNRLDLPQGKASYLLADFNGLLDTDQPFAQVAKALERILGLKQYDDALQRQAQHMAEHVEPFREHQPAPPTAEEGPILVRTADAKGVPMRQAADAPPIHSLDHQRGPKTGRKKQAIVGCVYTVQPWVRTAEDIIEALFRDPDGERPSVSRPRPCFKRGMARLNEYTDEAGAGHDGMAEVFAWMADQVDERNPKGGKVIVNIFDGDERLWDEKGPGGAAAEVDILDLMHGVKRLWEGAALLHRRDDPRCQAQVRAWLLKVLRGQVKAVVRDMRAKGEGLSAAKRKAMNKAANYLWRNRKRMRYHEYLKAGYPIASGVIEGACRHYVKDRMERTGMSWKQKGAQAMLQLRAVALNGDWDDFQDFYRRRQRSLLYPQRAFLEAVDWPIAA